MPDASSFVGLACHETRFRRHLRKAEETLLVDGWQKMPLVVLKRRDSPLQWCRQASSDALKMPQLLMRGNTRFWQAAATKTQQQLKVLVAVGLTVACGFSQRDLARIVINEKTPTPKPRWFREPLTTFARKP